MIHSKVGEEEGSLKRLLQVTRMECLLLLLFVCLFVCCLLFGFWHTTTLSIV